ncbi:culture filtrate antigen [Mycobacterium marinum MB2]|nr:culture filtrate antigen [Mycobacterium marinum MB2]
MATDLPPVGRQVLSSLLGRQCHPHCAEKKEISTKIWTAAQDYTDTDDHETGLLSNQMNF